MGIDFWLPEGTAVHALFDGELVMVANDAGFAKVWKSYSAFLMSMREYNDLTLKAYYQNR